jgi:hypothetical protein
MSLTQRNCPFKAAVRDVQDADVQTAENIMFVLTGAMHHLIEIKVNTGRPPSTWLP